VANVNLIPLYRQAAKARQRHLRAWILFCSAYSALLVLVYGVGYAHWAGPVRPLAAELSKADQATADLDKTLAARRADIDELAQRLDSAKSATMHADWSILLALVSETLGDDVVLEKCQLDQVIPQTPIAPVPTAAPAAPTAPAPKPPASAKPPKIVTPDPIWLFKADGLARNPQSVSQFILRLESSGLFDRVTLIKTSRESYRDREATSFNLECSLKTKGAK
jgi:hypothetical protein